MLDMLCLTGEMAWARLSPPPAESTEAARLTPATPIALFAREHAGAWQAMQAGDEGGEHDGPMLPANARAMLDLPAALAARRSSTISSSRSGLDVQVRRGSRSDRSSPPASRRRMDSPGLRALLDGTDSAAGRPSVHVRGASFAADGRRSRTGASRCTREQRRGTGLGVPPPLRRRLPPAAGARGVAAPWRELARVYRRLEARGEIRGGRFVSGMSGEQFALPRAVERLREVRRARGPTTSSSSISTADPMNLAGIVTAGDRVRAAARNRIAYRNGVPMAVMEGNVVRACASFEADVAEQVARALSRRRRRIVH